MQKKGETINNAQLKNKQINNRHMKTKSTNSNEPIWRDVFPYSKLPKKLEKLHEIGRAHV